MDDHRTTPKLRLLLAGLFVIGLVGCGGDDETSSTTGTTAASSTTSTRSTTSTSAEPTTSVLETTTTTTEPATSSSGTANGPVIVVDYRCGDGATGSTDVGTDDIEQIDDIVNTIDLCEFKDGLVELSFVAPCATGDRAVTLATVEGAVPDIATLDLCESP